MLSTLLSDLRAWGGELGGGCPLHLVMLMLVFVWEVAVRNGFVLAWEVAVAAVVEAAGVEGEGEGEEEGGEEENDDEDEAA